MNTIAKRLKYLIDSKEIKITQFCKICNIPYPTMQNYMLKERMISGDALLKICIHTDANINWLLTGEGKIYREKPIQKEKTTQFKSELFLNWLNEWWEQTDEKHRNWLEVQIKRCFPEYAEWLALKEKLEQEKSRH